MSDADIEDVFETLNAMARQEKELAHRQALVDASIESALALQAELSLSGQKQRQAYSAMLVEKAGLELERMQSRATLESHQTLVQKKQESLQCVLTEVAAEREAYNQQRESFIREVAEFQTAIFDTAYAHTKEETMEAISKLQVDLKAKQESVLAHRERLQQGAEDQLLLAAKLDKANMNYSKANMQREDLIGKQVQIGEQKEVMELRIQSAKEESEKMNRYAEELGAKKSALEKEYAQQEERKRALEQQLRLQGTPSTSTSSRQKGATLQFAFSGEPQRAPQAREKATEGAFETAASLLERRRKKK